MRYGKKPVIQVAKDYGVSGSMIKKACKKMEIPVPPPGYWAMLRAGKKVKPTPLPPTNGRTVVWTPDPILM